MAEKRAGRWLLVEVRSSGTEAYDRGDKFAGYRTIPSFQEYLLASQKEPRIELFTRQPNNSWNLRIFGPGERLDLVSVGCTVELDRVYEGVFDAAASAS